MRHRDVGLLLHDAGRATPGFTLVVPLVGRAAYLLGMRGEVLHQWQLPLTPGNYGYLLPNGNLLFHTLAPDEPRPMTGIGGHAAAEHQALRLLARRFRNFDVESLPARRGDNDEFGFRENLLRHRAADNKQQRKDHRCD